MDLNPIPAVPAEQPYDYVICLACGLPIRKSMVGKGGHLAVKHEGMTVKAYRAAYPDAIIYSPARLALEKARRQARPELARARSKRSRDKNPGKATQNTRNWEKKNPDRAKILKRRAARKYEPRRRMLRAARTPEQIEEERRKAREAYALRYPNRTPEQIERDAEQSRVKYQATQAKLERLRALEAQGALSIRNKQREDAGSRKRATRISHTSQSVGWWRREYRQS